MTTIGYGDKYPKTLPGRLLTFILSIWGVIIVSLMVIALSTFVEVTKRESKTFHMMKQMELSDIVLEKATILMQSFYKTWGVYKKKGAWFKGLKLGRKVAKFRKKFVEYKGSVKERDSHLNEHDIQDMILLHNDMLKNELLRNRSRQLDILEGANALLDKIQALRKKENGEKLEKRKKKKKKHKGKRGKGPGGRSQGKSTGDATGDKRKKNRRKKKKKNFKFD